MNKWLQKSIDFANTKNYLDRLFDVYPILPNETRSIETERWQMIVDAFNSRDDSILIKYLLHLDLFPIKNSYVSFLKRDVNASERNPETIKRICEQIYAMGLDALKKKCTQPKESNRQIGPLFKNWVTSGALGISLQSLEEFSKSSCDAILKATDTEMLNWAKKSIGYVHDKGLDFVARIKGRYIIGETKFLTDFGGHQNAQFSDALSLLTARANAIKIAVLDGVVYLKSQNKMYRTLTEEFSEENIFSSLFLKDFLNSI